MQQPCTIPSAVSLATKGTLAQGGVCYLRYVTVPAETDFEILVSRMEDAPLLPFTSSPHPLHPLPPPPPTKVSTPGTACPTVLGMKDTRGKGAAFGRVVRPRPTAYPEPIAAIRHLGPQGQSLVVPTLILPSR